MEVEKFMSQVYPEPNTGCWLWGGRHDEKGYGRLSHTLKFQVAHRMSFFIHNGEFDKKMHVLHKCDTPACVNPDHLYLGDQKQNNIDRDTRGRQKTTRGSAHKLAKIYEHDVILIRKFHDPKKFPSRKLARIFGVDQKIIMNVIQRKAWRHV